MHELYNLALDEKLYGDVRPQRAKTQDWEDNVPTPLLKVEAPVSFSSKPAMTRLCEIIVNNHASATQSMSSIYFSRLFNRKSWRLKAQRGLL